MSDTSWKTSLDDASGAYASVLFIIALAAEIYVGFRVRLKLEWSMIAISLAYLLSFVLILPIFNMPTYIEALFDAISYLIIWGVLYIFVFQTLKLREVLSS